MSDVTDRYDHESAAGHGPVGGGIDFVAALPDPDMVGSSEYRALHELLDSVAGSSDRGDTALEQLEELASSVAVLVEVAQEVADLLAAHIEAHSPADPPAPADPGT